MGLVANVTALAQAVAADIKSLLTSVAGKAAKGANSDITSLSALTTALSITQGGTGGTSQLLAQTALGLVKQTGVTDATTGSLLGVGAFGLGTSYAAGLQLLASADSVAPSGVYRYNSSTVSKPGFGSGFGELVNLPAIYSAGNYGNQLVIDYAADEMGFRRISGSGWLPWNRLYHSANAVGIVSQTSGVPTGAIIETGTNANGTYTKFADGTLICDSGGVSSNSPSIAVNTTNNTTITMPASFVAQWFIAPTAYPTAVWDHYGVVGSGSLNATQAQVFIRNGASAAQVFAVRFIAIGRWF